MSLKSLPARVLALTLWSLPIHAAERVFDSWDEFYRVWARSTAQMVLTNPPADWLDGEQVSRDFRVGDQTLRLFNPPARTIRLNDKPLRVAVDWPKVVRGEVDLAGAPAFTYPGTELLVCVQANFQGLGQSGSFQNFRQLTLVFRATTPRGKARIIRVTGYGFDCRGISRVGEGWQFTQVVEGERGNEKELKRWRLGEKGLTPLAQTTTFRMTEDGNIVTPGEQLP